MGEKVGLMEISNKKTVKNIKLKKLGDLGLPKKIWKLEKLEKLWKHEMSLAPCDKLYVPKSLSLSMILLQYYTPNTNLKSSDLGLQNYLSHRTSLVSILFRSLLVPIFFGQL